MADFTEKTIAKALRDAYGQGRRHGADRPIERTEAIAKVRDAWIRQYMARLPAVTPITTAPTPTDRVGEDVGRGFTFEQPQRGRMFDVLRRLGQAAINLQKITDHEMAHMAQSRCLDDIEALVAEALAAKESVGWPWDEVGTRLRNCSIQSIAGGEPERYLIKIGCPDIQTMQAVRDGMVQLREANPAALASAPAPSDPAGAGGDLGELERLSKAATQGEWSQDDGSDGGPSLPEEHRIYGDTNGGYLVARIPNFSGYPENKANAAYIAALVNAHRSGQIVASTPGQKGAGEEKTVEEESPCHWGGGNDIIWCSTCGAEYAYAKGEERPACPRAPQPGAAR
ncbi:hypothetical protein [Methylobacterium sp. 391_Methyba4]|uniref:hypothetical protein n=1 Tax=Methylobacterium sp. 391_Methyba4 TaxID=3038924 RepID=UPI00241DCD3B|nr:hypothetical protein [Methylobacterium sp. 391_Methyba4]WFS07748.1 hypothetical protein P9K36_00125 [Methylobacterium sp. 391_Methyba4]